MRSSDSLEVTTASSLAVQRVAYLAAVTQIVACFMPAVSDPVTGPRTWLERGVAGYGLLALGLLSLWLAHRARYGPAALAGASSAIIGWLTYFQLMLNRSSPGMSSIDAAFQSPEIGLFIAMLAPLILLALPLVSRRDGPSRDD